MIAALNPRTALALAHDIVAVGLAWIAAYLLRFNFDTSDFYFAGVWPTLPYIVVTQTAVFLLFGLYRGMWRYASVPDLRRIVLASVVGITATALVLLMARLPVVVPRSVFVLDPILLIMLMGGSRLAYRIWKEHRLVSLGALDAQPVLILGAGDAGAILVKELAKSREWRVVGLLDDNVNKRGRQIHALPVLGRFDDLPAVASRMAVSHAIIALPSASHTERRRAVEICTQAGLKPLTVPAFDDLVSGRVTVSELRHVELDDLLGRDPVSLDTGGLREWLRNRVVMVTGAGGSIGAELCRQVARFEPCKLVLFELNEFALYTVEQEFQARHPGLPLASAIGDVKDRARVSQVIRQYRPAVIFHAAAYKHVPLMEDDNAWQAVLNNVGGTVVLARAAIEHGVEKFVFVSTDKAVNPTSVMGASKRLAEMVCQALQSAASPGAGAGSTRFVMVRFGNVLGSTGSVIPRFREQIAAGGPITVTHPEVTRYFMSIPEAVQLVLQAGLMGKGGEVFVLDMGQPVRIADLARDLIKLSGYASSDIEIVYTGLRPGEKLYEEPLAADENALPTPHPKLKIARARQEDQDWLRRLDEWLARSGTPDTVAVKTDLAKWVPEYSSSEGAAAEGGRRSAL
jgi:FlaA1/EpsC-like NDP-sugar epimerase